MKKFTILTTFALVCLLAACGAKDKTNEAAEAQEQLTEETGPPADSHDGHEGHAHGEHEAEPEETAETAPHDVLANDGSRKIGDVTTCPVTGDVFRVTDTSPTVEHEGKTFYMCCKGCVAKFEADPAKFIAAAETSSDEASGDDDAPPTEESSEPATD